MRHYLALHLATLAVALLALAKWLDSDNRPGPRKPAQLAHQVDLPKNRYRFQHEPPGKWEVIKLGLGILFNSLTWAMGASYG